MRNIFGIQRWANGREREREGKIHLCKINLMQMYLICKYGRQWNVKRKKTAQADTHKHATWISWANRNSFLCKPNQFSWFASGPFEKSVTIFHFLFQNGKRKYEGREGNCAYLEILLSDTQRRTKRQKCRVWVRKHCRQSNNTWQFQVFSIASCSPSWSTFSSFPAFLTIKVSSTAPEAAAVPCVSLRCPVHTHARTHTHKPTAKTMLVRARRGRRRRRRRRCVGVSRRFLNFFQLTWSLYPDKIESDFFRKNAKSIVSDKISAI